MAASIIRSRVVPSDKPISLSMHASKYLLYNVLYTHVIYAGGRIREIYSLLCLGFHSPFFSFRSSTNTSFNSSTSVFSVMGTPDRYAARMTKCPEVGEVMKTKIIPRMSRMLNRD